MSDLDILNNLSNEELEVIVRLIIDEGGLTEQLTDSDDYKRYKPNHRMYIDAIKEEIINNEIIKMLSTSLLEAEHFLFHECLRRQTRTRRLRSNLSSWTVRR